MGPERYKLTTLATDEFIRRFLIHVLPTGFHRIRHYGLFASGVRAHDIAHAREFLAAPIPRRQASASLYLVTAKTLNELPHPVSPVAKPTRPRVSTCWGLRAPVQHIGNQRFDGVTTVTPKLRYLSGKGAENDVRGE
jgi:hypothetical protein